MSIDRTLVDRDFLIDVTHNPGSATSFAIVWPPNTPPRKVFRPGHGLSLARLYNDGGVWTVLRSSAGADAVLASAYAKLTAELPNGLAEVAGEEG